MSGFGGIWPKLLGGAIGAARITLQDLEAAEVPAPLARIAASQGGRLPPPLANRLLAELDANEWLRAKVAAEYEADESDPSWLFLNRPDQWWVSLVAAAAGTAQEEYERKVEALQAKLEESEERRSLAIKRAKESKKAAAGAEAEAKRLREAVKSDVTSRYAAEIADVDALRAELAESTSQLEMLREEHRELQAGFATVRARLAKARRGRVAESAGAGATDFVPSDPVRLARMLDLQSAAFGRDMAEPVAPPRHAEHAVALAPGVRPDSSDAIRWLLDLEEGVVVLVDGYNAQFHIDGSDFTSGASRRNLIDILQRLRSAAEASHRIVVVYDSILPGARDPGNAIGGVEVRFAADDSIADEEIVDMASVQSPVVVISSDREVREGAERKGAVVLWSEALADWVGRS